MTDADTARHKIAVRAGVRLFVILATIALLLVGFAAIADEFSELGRLARLDLSVLNWLQLHGSERGERVFQIVSWLGAPILVVSDIAVAIALAVRRRWHWFTLWAVAIVGGVVLDEALKLVFRRVRPAVASEFISSGSWSFPSGHAMNALVGYTMLAYLLCRHVPSTRTRVYLSLGTAILIAAIGFSRLYLGVHYFSDVIAGYLAGGAWVMACIAINERYYARATGDGEP